MAFSRCHAFWRLRHESHILALSHLKTMTDTARLTAALAGRYAIERELGAGGMATVYLARDLKHDRDVALKVLRPELAAVLGAERFLQEIHISARLDHPHILTLIDSGECDGFVWYVLPYVRGESLREKLTREKQLSLEEAVRIATQVASALDYAHRHGLIHRDIKPENILLHEGEAVGAGFWIALGGREGGGAGLDPARPLAGGRAGRGLAAPSHGGRSQPRGCGRPRCPGSPVAPLAAACEGSAGDGRRRVRGGAPLRESDRQPERSVSERRHDRGGHRAVGAGPRPEGDLAHVDGGIEGRPPHAAPDRGHAGGPAHPRGLRPPRRQPHPGGGRSHRCNRLCGPRLRVSTVGRLCLFRRRPLRGRRSGRSDGQPGDRA